MCWKGRADPFRDRHRDSSSRPRKGRIGNLGSPNHIATCRPSPPAQHWSTSRIDSAGSQRRIARDIHPGKYQPIDMYFGLFRHMVSKSIGLSQCGRKTYWLHPRTRCFPLSNRWPVMYPQSCPPTQAEQEAEQVPPMSA